MDDLRGNPHARSSVADLVRRMLRAVAEKRFDEAGQLMADDIAFDNGRIGSVAGRAATLEVLSNGLLSQSAEADWRVDRVVMQGSVVVFERVDRFLVGETWVEIPVAGVFEVRSGRVSVWRDYCDLGTVERQLNPELRAIPAKHHIGSV